MLWSYDFNQILRNNKRVVKKYVFAPFYFISSKYLPILFLHKFVHPPCKPIFENLYPP